MRLQTFLSGKFVICEHLGKGARPADNMARRSLLILFAAVLFNSIVFLTSLLGKINQ